MLSVVCRPVVQGGGYRHYPHNILNRRIHAETPIFPTGPVAGHALLRTSSDPRGTSVNGTFSNCGGGVTPWGTHLTAEENFDQYSANNNGVTNEMAKVANTRFGVTDEGGRRPWSRFHRRIDLNHEPNEINKLGWVVEIDPFRPYAAPKKRTALGWFKDEAAAATLSAAGNAIRPPSFNQRVEAALASTSACPVQHRRSWSHSRCVTPDGQADSAVLSVALSELTSCGRMAVRPPLAVGTNSGPGGRHVAASDGRDEDNGSLPSVGRFG